MILFDAVGLAVTRVACSCGITLRETTVQIFVETSSHCVLGSSFIVGDDRRLDGMPSAR